MFAIKVMIIDGSAVVRQVLSKILQEESMEVVGATKELTVAMEMMARQWPDLIVLDLAIPGFDGLAFLKTILTERPNTVVLGVIQDESHREVANRALKMGAVEIVNRPKLAIKEYLQDSSNELLKKVRMRSRRLAPPIKYSNAAARFNTQPIHSSKTRKGSYKLVAIGISTGGPQTLEAVLVSLPASAPCILVVQHMPQQFTGQFARRLDSLCRMEVKEASDGDQVKPGRVLIAPGDRHMRLIRKGMSYAVEVIDGGRVSHHRPSVDVLFSSVAKHAGRDALGIIMTGMGGDGAVGLKAMQQAGSMTIAQDEASCVVYGMPKEAVKQGGVERVLSLNEIPAAILE